MMRLRLLPCRPIVKHSLENVFYIISVFGALIGILWNRILFIFILFLNVHLIMMHIGLTMKISIFCEINYCFFVMHYLSLCLIIPQTVSYISRCLSMCYDQSNKRKISDTVSLCSELLMECIVIFKNNI